jgi:hypothetical protein
MKNHSNIGAYLPATTWGNGDKFSMSVTSGPPNTAQGEAGQWPNCVWTLDSSQFIVNNYTVNGSTYKRV